MMYADDYDKIMLSLKEKWLLRRILKKKTVSYDFCNDTQRELFLKYDLVYIQQNQIVSDTGSVYADPNAPKYIVATDKAFRYFLYRQDDCFKGKFPVVIALIALLKACDKEIVWLFRFISNWIANL